MRKLFLILIISLFFNVITFAAECENPTTIKTYTDNSLWGLKQENGEIITNAEYNKIVRLGNSSWIVQKNEKYGIMNNDGDYLVKPKYRHAERFLGKYAKLGNTNDFGVYDENGNIIVEPIYRKIEVLFGKMFLTYRNYKYGITDFNGVIILDNKFDDIYMPSPKVIRVKYNGNWYEIERSEANHNIVLGENSEKVSIVGTEYIITIVTNTGVATGYSALTLTDYIIKIISTISPAYEDTIDELMLSHGTDTVNIFMKLRWLPQFPITYIQKYYQNYVNPNNGPLSEVRSTVKKQWK